MQVVLVIIAVVGAVSYLGWQFYKRFYAKEAKCDGCAVSKIQSQQ